MTFKHHLIEIIKPAKFFLQQNYRQQAFFSLPAKKIGELYILRHAKSEHNEKGCCAGYYNESLPTFDGIEEARKAGKLLSASGIKFDTLYVSPLDRALITAQAILAELPVLEVVTDEALAERNFGAFTGMSKNEIKEMLSPEEFKQYIHDKNFFPPDIGPGHKYFQSKKLYGSWPSNHKGESYQCVINRLISFQKKVEEKLLQGKTIIVVGHSHNLQMLQMILRRAKFKQGIEKYKISHVTPMKYSFSLDVHNKLMVKEVINLSENEALSECGRLIF